MALSAFKKETAAYLKGTSSQFITFQKFSTGWIINTEKISECREDCAEKKIGFGVIKKLKASLPGISGFLTDKTNKIKLSGAGNRR